MFEVGEVVVCVDASIRDHVDACHISAAQMLEQGKFYRVDALEFGGLKGIGGMRHPFGLWAADRFRKLPKASSDFTAMIRKCKPQRVKEPA
jgi:hypothetical protein